MHLVDLVVMHVSTMLWTLAGNCIMEGITLTFEWYMRRLVVKNRHYNIHVLQWDWIMRDTIQGSKLNVMRRIHVISF